jgi:predicted N-acetyltransferase YhbS
VTDWAAAIQFGEGLVAECDGEVVATAARWRWGERHATIGHMIVAPRFQGRGLGRRLLGTLLEDLQGRTVLLYATDEGRGLYQHLGFERIGKLGQHQGTARPSVPTALATGWRLRPAGQRELDALVALDERARGMPRGSLIANLFEQAEATVVLDRNAEARGFAMLRRFGFGHVIGPVVAGDVAGAKALIAYLSGMNAGRFTRVDVDLDSDLGDWLERLGLSRVGAPTAMLRGAPLAEAADTRLYAVVTQALG